MPYYRFACDHCAIRFDVRASIAEKTAGLHPQCPSCGAQQVRQIITAPVTLTLSPSTSFAASEQTCGCGPGKPCR